MEGEFQAYEGSAQYQGGDWSGFLYSRQNVTAAKALEIAANDPAVDFFFFVHGPENLSLPMANGRNFSPGEAAFFKGNSWLTSAPQAVAYVKRSDQRAHSSGFYDEIAAWYAFDVDGTDFSGNAHEITLGTTVQFAPGRWGFGNSISFDSAKRPDGILTIPTGIVPSGSSSAMAFWVKPSTPTSCETVSLVEPVSYVKGDQTISVNLGGQTLTSEKSIPSGKWSHVAVVYDEAAKQGRLYLNGFPDSAITIPSTPSGPLHSLKPKTLPVSIIGAAAGSGFDGQIDDLAVFNQVITSTDVSLIAYPRRESLPISAGGERQAQPQFWGYVALAAIAVLSVVLIYYFVTDSGSQEAAPPSTSSPARQPVATSGFPGGAPMDLCKTWSAVPGCPNSQYVCYGEGRIISGAGQDPYCSCPAGSTYDQASASCTPGASPVADIAYSTNPKGSGSLLVTIKNASRAQFMVSPSGAGPDCGRMRSWWESESRKATERNPDDPDPVGNVQKALDDTCKIQTTGSSNTLYVRPSCAALGIEHSYSSTPQYAGLPNPIPLNFSNYSVLEWNNIFHILKPVLKYNKEPRYTQVVFNANHWFERQYMSESAPCGQPLGLVIDKGSAVGTTNVGKFDTFIVSQGSNGNNDIQFMRGDQASKVANPVVAVSGYQILRAGKRTSKAKSGKSVPFMKWDTPTGRTAVGYNSQTDTLYVFVMQKSSKGMTIPDLAYYLQNSLKATDAIALDGGGSSQMIVSEAGHTKVQVGGSPRDRSDGGSAEFFRPVPVAVAIRTYSLTGSN